MKNKFMSKIRNNIDIIFIILVVILIRGIIYSPYQNYSVYPDTETYIDYEANLFKGEVDELRTPVYPTVLKLISVFGKNIDSIYINTTIFQEILSIISIIVLYVTLKKTFKNKAASYVAIILYGCFPVIFTYNRIILTESLSISIFVMYFCLIIRYLAEPTTKKTVYIGLITMFLIFLRPSFLFLIVELAIIFTLIFFCQKENRKQVIIGAGAIVCIVISIVGYSYLNKINNGVFGISSVTQINQIDIIIQMNIYDTGDPRDEEIIGIINQRLDGYDAEWNSETKIKIMEQYSPDEIGEYLSRCFKNNLGKSIIGLIEKTAKVAVRYSDEIYLSSSNGVPIKPMIPFVLLYVYIIFDGLCFIAKIIKNKKIPLEQTIIIITVLGQFATLLIGANAEFSRLFLPVLPIIFISIAWNIDEIITWYKKETTEQIQAGEEKENEISN